MNLASRRPTELRLTIESSPPSKEEGWLTWAATAFRSAASVFVFHQDAEAYNHVVVAESDGSFSVYLFPATSRKNVRVRGADGVVQVGTDGQATVQRYHRKYFAQELTKTTADVAAAAHNLPRVSAPNPLDVFYAIHFSSPEEYIIGRTWSFVIDGEGTIQSLGSTREFKDRLEARLGKSAEQ